MALTDTQRQQLVMAKQQGLSKEQAMARVFNRKSETPAQPESRFGDVGEDITSAFRGAGSDLVQRGENIREGFAAGARGEQTPIETGAQMAGNVLGGAGDLAFRGVQALATPFMKQSEEDAIAQGVGKAVEATGLPQAFEGTSDRTQRNIIGGLGLFEGATAGAGAALTKPATKGVTSRIGKFFGRNEDATPTAPDTGAKTPEQVFERANNRLNEIARDENIDPRAREEAANSALSFKERYIGLTPDVKSRLGQMGPQKLQEYLDAAHIRNIDDTAPTPYEVGAQNVNTALDTLNSKLNETGSEIGQARKKLATIKAPITSVKRVEDTFNTELGKLNLTVRNGQVVQKPGTVSKTAAASDVRVLQSLYDEMQVFKQSPTLKNAIDLRMAFDGKIKFGKAARDVSNSVDPVSRAVRASLARESASVVGKSNAAELQRYSDFMEAYGDLKSYTDRAAGGEYLLRLVLSGRGGEARKLIDTVKEYTGTDLMNDATAMKVATETLGNENTRNLFRQEVTRAGYDAAALVSGGPVGVAQVIGAKLLDYGIDAEDVLKKVAAGGTAGTAAYLLMEDNPEFAPAIGFAIGSISPQGRREITSRVAKLADEATIGEMQDFSRVVREGGVTTNNKGELQFKEIEGLPQKRVQRVFEDGLRVIEMDADTFNQLGDKSPGDIAKFYDEVIEQVETDSSFNQGATPQTTLLEEAKGKTLDEFVKGQGQTLFHGGKESFSQFDTKKFSQGEGGDLFGKGAYLTDNQDLADFYAQAVAKKDFIVGNKQDGALGADNPIFAKDADTLAKKKAVVNEFVQSNLNLLDVSTYKVDGGLKDIFTKDLTSRGYSKAEAMEEVNRKLNNARNKSSNITGYRGELDYMIKQFGVDPKISDGVSTYLQKQGYDGLKYKSDTAYEGPGGNNYVIYNPEKLMSKSQLEDIWKQANE